MNTKSSLKFTYPNEYSNFRLRTSLRFIPGHIELNRHKIDLQAMFARVILQDACDKGLCKVEATQPKYIWFAVVNPITLELQALQQVCDVTTQWL